MLTSKSAVGDVGQMRVELAEGRIECPPRAVPGENREERHEPRRTAALELEAVAPRQAQLPRHGDGHTLACGQFALDHERGRIGAARRHRASARLHGADRQTCAAPGVERRVRPEPKDEAVGCHFWLERDGERARRFLQALTDADVQDILRPITRCRGKSQRDRARERPGLRTRRVRLQARGAQDGDG